LIVERDSLPASENHLRKIKLQHMSRILLGLPGKKSEWTVTNQQLEELQKQAQQLCHSQKSIIHTYAAPGC
jgi:type II secretory pathway component PulL